MVPVNAGKLVLRGGSLMDIKPNNTENSVTLSAGSEAGSVDPELIAKYNAMLEGGSGTYRGTPYIFYGPLRYQANWSANFSTHEITIDSSFPSYNTPNITVGSIIMVSYVSDPVCSLGTPYVVKSGDETSFIIDVPDIANYASGILRWVDLADAGAPYYFSSMVGSQPVDGHMFLTAKQCDHIGLFTDGIHPTRVGSTPIKGSLEITDVCAPCVDCTDYEALYEYLDLIKDKLDYKKNLIYKHTSYIPGSFVQNNVLELVKQSMLYWNNMVQQTSWRCHALADGSEINAAAMVTNHFDKPILPGLTLSIFFAAMPIIGKPRGFVIDKVVPSHWLPGDYTVAVEPPGAIYKYESTYTAITASETVTITPDTPPANPLPSISAGDYIWLVTATPIVCDQAKAYKVISGNNISFTIDVSDGNIEPGNLTGTLAWEPVIKLVITTNKALEVSESIKLYAGAIAPFYVGNDAVTTVIFSNNLTDLDIVGYPVEKILNTNNMVCVDPRFW